MPPPKMPAEVQAERGAPGHRPVNIVPVEIIGPASIEPPPEMTDEGRAIWRRLAPELIAANLLRATDAETFAELCEAFALAKQARAMLKQDGAIYETVTEHVTMKRLHPAYMILDRSQRVILQYAAHFGLTPAARQSVYAHELSRGGQQANPDESDLFGGERALPGAGPLGILAN